MISRRLAARLGLPATLLLGAVLGIACGRPPAACLYDPHCGSGDFGAFCDRDNDCVDGYCCDSDACNNGMCSWRCDNHDECPGGFKCSGGACFYACDSDSQCAAGQDCNKGACKW